MEEKEIRGYRGRRAARVEGRGKRRQIVECDSSSDEAVEDAEGWEEESEYMSDEGEAIDTRGGG